MKLGILNAELEKKIKIGYSEEPLIEYQKITSIGKRTAV